MPIVDETFLLLGSRSQPAIHSYTNFEVAVLLQTTIKTGGTLMPARFHSSSSST